MTRLRSRLIAAFLASTLLPLGATVWITTSLLDRSLRYATTGELDRLVADAREHRQAVLPARARRAEAGRARRPDDDRRSTRRRTRPSGPSPSDRSGRAASPSALACRAPAASASTTCGGRTARRRAWRRDLQPRPGRRQHGAAVRPASADAPPRERDRRARSAAGIHADAARAAGCRVAGFAAAAGPDRPPGQPADPAAHRGPDRFRRRRLVAAAGDRPAARRPAARRSRPGRRRLQPHGGSTRGEPRAARAPDAHGELAVAGAQDRARAEELADADPADGRGDAGAAAGRSSARSWTRPSRSSSARSSRSSAACGPSPSSRASRRCIPRISTSTPSSPSGWRCCARCIPE